MREQFSKRGRIALAIAATGVAAVAVVAVACGGSKSTASSAPISTASASTSPAANTTPGRGFGNRTPPPAIQTSIAEGTRPAGFGGGGVGRLLGAIATALNIDVPTLRTELQAQGATLATVAQNHGVDRATLRQDLMNAEQQRLASQVQNGQMAQADADAAQNQFNANVDQLMDQTGLGQFGGGGGGGAPSGPPPGAPQ